MSSVIPQTDYTTDQLDKFYKSNPAIFHDEGFGATQSSIKYFESLKGMLGQIIEINVSGNRHFTFELQCSAGFVLLSGCNCGYGGTGPHGTVQILQLLGFKDYKNYEEQIFGENEVKIDCREKGCFW